VLLLSFALMQRVFLNFFCTDYSFPSIKKYYKKIKTSMCEENYKIHAVKGFSGSGQNVVFTISCFTNCKSGVQDTRTFSARRDQTIFVCIFCNLQGCPEHLSTSLKLLCSATLMCIDVVKYFEHCPMRIKNLHMSWLGVHRCIYRMFG
jgi:hypothetical protein